MRYRKGTAVSGSSASIEFELSYDGAGVLDASRGPHGAKTICIQAVVPLE